MCVKLHSRTKTSRQSRKVGLYTTFQMNKPLTFPSCSDFLKHIVLTLFDISKSAPLYRHCGSVQAVRSIGGVEI